MVDIYHVPNKYKTQSVGIATFIRDITLVINSSPYTADELLSDVVEIPNVFRLQNETGFIESLSLIDKAAVGAALDLFFTNDSTSWGTINAAPTITDAVAGNILGAVSVAAADYLTLSSGNSIATYSNLGIGVVSAANSTSLYVAAITRGTPTYGSASDLVLRLGISSN